MQPRQQAADRAWALHLGGQRGCCIAVVVGLRRHQGQPAFAELPQRIHQRVRRIHQHGFDQLAQRAFHCVFPAGLNLDAFADAGRTVQPVRLQPLRRRALFLPERGLLQGFQ